MLGRSPELVLFLPKLQKSQAAFALNLEFPDHFKRNSLQLGPVESSEEVGTRCSIFSASLILAGEPSQPKKGREGQLAGGPSFL